MGTLDFFPDTQFNNYVYLRAKNLDIYMEKDAENQKSARKFKCYVCGKEFNTLSDLVRHDLKLKTKKVPAE